MALSATDLVSHRFQHERSRATSLSSRGHGSSLMSSVVPTTGRSPRSVQSGGLSFVPTMAAASGSQPSLAMDCSACPSSSMVRVRKVILSRKHPGVMDRGTDCWM